MPETTRTFVALELPEAGKQALEEVQRRLEPHLAGLRWVKPAQMHLTLAFLGEVPTRRLAEVAEAAGRATAGVEPFGLELEGLGAFPNLKRPRVLWAGLTGAAVGDLVDLQGRLIRELRAAGFRPDDRGEFTPHVTLARADPKRGRTPDLTAVVAEHASWRGGAVPVAELVTFGSELTPRGPLYTVLARSALASGDRQS